MTLGFVNGSAETMTERVDILIQHGLLVTVDRERRLITDDAVAVRGDRIIAVGKEVQYP